MAHSLADGPSRVVEEEILALTRMKRAWRRRSMIRGRRCTSTACWSIGTGGTLIAYRWWGDWRNS
ncbi:MAG: hypothetical protein R2873_34705 [Caldilineaceae bacterium]